MCIMCIMFYYNLYIPIVINQFFIINEGTCEGTYEGTNTKEPIRRNQWFPRAPSFTEGNMYSIIK